MYIPTYNKKQNTLPPIQLSFSSNHNTIHQVYRVVDATPISLESNRHCTGVFLDILLDICFDIVWHEGIQFKLPKCLIPAVFSIN